MTENNILRKLAERDIWKFLLEYDWAVMSTKFEKVIFVSRSWIQWIQFIQAESLI